MTRSTLLLLAGACLAAAQALQAAQPQPDRRTPEMSDVIELTQGIPWRNGEAALGLSNVFVDGGAPRAQLSFIDAPSGDPDVTLASGAVLPVGGRFVQVGAIVPAAGGTRATVQLQPVADAGGIAPPDAGHPVLLQQGRLRTGGGWIAAIDIAPDTAIVERWPLGQARSRLSSDAVETRTLRVGDTLDTGDAQLRVLRIQPPAGELLGFVELVAD
ncbi:hypothetical protein [Luteimonas sp. R10]|uniref:hypothetical protein n=1 Tax=Luteimonas sp. R10 TaxID=3108176 RepID=UPI00308C819E|nr:hypothetical protein U3649_17815 [Luteimonas sp. R10]